MKIGQEKQNSEITNNAKKWFTEKAAAHPEIWSENKNKLDWDCSFIITTLGKINYVIVPYKNLVLFAVKGTGASRQVLIRLNGENQAEDANVLETFSNENYLTSNKKMLAKNYMDKSLNAFTGGIIYYDLKYNIIENSYFNKGNERGKFNMKSRNGNSGKPASTSKQRTTTTCFAIYFGIWHEDGSFEPLYFVDSFCFVEEGGNNGGFNWIEYSSGGTGYGTPGGGNNNNATTPPVYVTLFSDCLTHAVEDVLNTVDQNTQEHGITNLISMLFAGIYTNPTAYGILNVNQDYTLPHPAWTTVPAPGAPPVYTITMNSNFFTGQFIGNAGVHPSKEYWAAVFVHEVVHTFIDQYDLSNGIISTTLDQHETMITSWVNAISAFMQNVYPDISPDEGIAFALNGVAGILQSNNQVSNAAWNSYIQSHYGLSTTQVIDLITPYKTLIKGTYCEN